MPKKDLQPRLRINIADLVRILAGTLTAMLSASIRRMLGRRRRHGWGFGYEVLVAGQRGSWSKMCGMGVVRFRNAGDTLTPLRTNGLKPEFVEHEAQFGTLRGAWLTPPGIDGPALLYFHGGGFVFGSLRSHGNVIGAIARSSKARTFALDYRLAPEHPMPAALTDALGAYRYLLGQGISPRQLVLAGDSAGGNLVLSTLLTLRDAGDPLPAAGVAISPWVDLACSGDSFRTNAIFDYVAEEHCRLAAREYLAGADPRRPDISPLFANLSGLPPLLLQAGAAETLVDQVRDFSNRAHAAGVDVQLSVYDDMVHVWHLLGSVTPQSQRGIDEVGAFVRKHALRSI